jgi:hypothetical protein
MLFSEGKLFFSVAESHLCNRFGSYDGKRVIRHLYSIYQSPDHLAIRPLPRLIKDQIPKGSCPSFGGMILISVLAPHEIERMRAHYAEFELKGQVEEFLEIAVTPKLRLAFHELQSGLDPAIRACARRARDLNEGLLDLSSMSFFIRMLKASLTADCWFHLNELEIPVLKGVQELREYGVHVLWLLDGGHGVAVALETT